MDKISSNSLINIFFSTPEIDIDNSLIKKGELKIKLEELKTIIKEQHENKLPNYYDDYFKLKLSSKNEPIILMGPSSYKTHLTEFYINSETMRNPNLINLNQKTTIEELLGKPIFLSNIDAKNFYFNLLCQITHKKINKKDKEIILDKENIGHEDKINIFEKQINESD